LIIPQSHSKNERSKTKTPRERGLTDKHLKSY
jgi:hypothetical protein